MNRSATRLAEICERVLIPALVVYTLGLITMESWAERRVSEATQAVSQARLQVRHASAQLLLYRQACDPLLSWPVAATPELLSNAPQGAQP
jgi:hypothetical protein